jgi:hypothetical protein
MVSVAHAFDCQLQTIGLFYLQFSHADVRFLFSVQPKDLLAMRRLLRTVTRER